MFGMGIGELVTILIIGILVFGATRLPGMGSLGDLLRGEHRPPPPRLVLRRRNPWSLSDWVAFGLAVILAVTTLALLLRTH